MWQHPRAWPRPDWGLNMSTVPNAPGRGWERRFDPLRRHEEFADVFAAARARDEVTALVALARRGVLDVVWLRELFVDANSLVPLVFALDRDALREAYARLFMEEPLITTAVREAIGGEGVSGLPVHVVDAIGEVIGAVTSVESLAEAWVWFLNGDIDAPE